MPTWKLNIFVNAIKARMTIEKRAAIDILQEYVVLNDDEKNEIINAINN